MKHNRSTIRFRTMLVLTAATFALLPCSAGVAATTATLVGTDLGEQAITIQSLRDGVLSYFGEDRTFQTRPLGEFLQLRDVTATEQTPRADVDATSLMVVEMIDGQRLIGQWMTDRSADGEMLHWRHGSMGEAIVPLEKVRRVCRVEALSRKRQDVGGESSGGDRVVLVNGDVLNGFVTAVTPTGIAIQPAGQDAASPVPLDRIVSIDLVNPMRVEHGKAHLVWLVDGSRVAARDVTMDDDRLKLEGTLFGESASPAVAVHQVSRIDIANPRSAMVDLADQPLAIVAGGEVFGLPWPPRVGDRGIDMHAPITVTWELPPGVRRFAATAELAVEAGAPRAAIQWADFVATFSVDGREVASHRLNAGQTGVRINVPVDGVKLEVKLAAGVNGPVMDRLRLRHAVLLIDF